MELSAPFSELSRLVERLERSGVDVRAVESTRRALVADGVLGVTIEFRLSLADAFDASWATVSADGAEVGSDGRLSASISVETALLPDDPAITAKDAKTTVDGDVLTVTLPVEISVGEDDATGDVAKSLARDARAVGRADPDCGTGSESNGRLRAIDSTDESTAGPAGGDAESDGASDAESDGASDAESGLRAVSADRGVPVFRDHDRLQAAYDSHETFAEMRDALGVDVTAETIRRYMIDAGVHDPDTYQTGSEDGTDDEAATASEGPDAPEGTVGAETAGSSADAEPSDEVLYADGIGLPDGLTVDGLIDTITASNTLYEVSRALDVERGRARDALAELNLLDLVVGRLAMESEREVTREEVIDRLREADTGA